MTKNTVTQRLFVVALLVSVVFLSVVFGMATHKFKIWPYPLFQNAYKAAEAWREKLTPPPSRYDNPNVFIKARNTSGGIFRYNKEKAYNGFTLFTSAHACKAFLISMTGEVVHEWHLPFSSVWPNPPHVEFPVSEKFIYWRKAHLYPNGDLLAIYVGVGDTPWGYGLVKIDKDSKIIWKYAERTHHDVNVGSDGKIYVLTHKFTQMPRVDLKTPVLDDSVVVLSPDGQELKKVSISMAFHRSEFSSIFDVLGKTTGNKWDPWHANAVDVLDEQIADKFPFLEKGQVLVSLRNLDVIAIIDMNKEQVVWTSRGPWYRQHDSDFLANGNMLVFDNRGNYGKGNLSRVVEFKPSTLEIVWQYTGDEKDTLFSWGRASQQRLANGNTLINETNNGRIFEVTPKKEIVWEFRTQFRAPDDNQLVALVFWGRRFNPDSLQFEFSHPK